MARAKINIPEQRIREFCRDNHIRKLSLFGSVIRDDFDATSDVDILVEFEPDHIPGLQFFAMECELADMLGRKVELYTPYFLSADIRGRVAAEAEVQYVAP
jgi:predicted nucleotidyltransferase